MWKKDKQSNDEWVWGTAYIHMGSSIYSIPFFVSGKMIQVHFKTRARGGKHSSLWVLRRWSYVFGGCIRQLSGSEPFMVWILHTHFLWKAKQDTHHFFGYVWVSSLCFSSIFCEFNQEQISFWSCSCKPVILILH